MGSFSKYKIDNYEFYIGCDKDCITRISLDKIEGYQEQETEIINKAKQELEEYFKKKRITFDLPLKLQGTEFQKKVWRVMQNIPYGTTVSYKTLAQLAGNPKAARAVGNVCHNNKILIVIPCHRVVSSHGLGGFGCSLGMKIDLLELEGQNNRYLI